MDAAPPYHVDNDVLGGEEDEEEAGRDGEHISGVVKGSATFSGIFDQVLRTTYRIISHFEVSIW